jgi:hypothetical protein
MQGRFANIQTLLQTLIAGFADLRAACLARMMPSESASRRGSTRDIGVRLKQLRFELPEEFLPLMLNYPGVRTGSGRGL